MTNHLYDALFGRHAGSDAPFLILPDGQALSYRDFLAKVGRHAQALGAAGLRPGDRVALQLEKSPDMLAVIAAAITASMSGLFSSCRATRSPGRSPAAPSACAWRPTFARKSR